MIVSLIIVGVIIFILQNFTTLNIITSNIFFSKKLKAYPYMENGVFSNNYVLERIKCNLTPRVLYHPENNFFLIYGHCKIQKRDAYGKQVFVIDYDMNEMGYPEFAPYVFTKHGVLDFTKAHIEKQAYTKIINENQNLTNKDWHKTYNELYKKAEQVIYGNTINYSPTFGIYYKIDNLWYKLYSLKGKKYDSRGGHITYGKDLLPPKYTPLVLLKDQKRKKYSNYWNEEDVSLYKITEHYSHTYSQTKNLNSSLFYKKSGRIETAPFGFDSDKYYKYKIKDDVLKFKEAAVKRFVGGWAEYIHEFQVPDKYKNKTNVVFLHYSYLNNYHDERSRGMYIIRKR